MPWDQFTDQLWRNVISTSVFTLVGLIFFGLALWVVEWITPFSIQKEITKEKNVAMGIIVGSLLIAIALIVSAAAHG